MYIQGVGLIPLDSLCKRAVDVMNARSITIMLLITSISDKGSSKEYDHADESCECTRRIVQDLLHPGCIWLGIDRNVGEEAKSRDLIHCYLLPRRDVIPDISLHGPPVVESVVDTEEQDPYEVSACASFSVQG